MKKERRPRCLESCWDGGESKLEIVRGLEMGQKRWKKKEMMTTKTMGTAMNMKKKMKIPEHRSLQWKRTCMASEIRSAEKASRVVEEPQKKKDCVRHDGDESA